jgi:hypothetical protein
MTVAARRSFAAVSFAALFASGISLAPAGTTGAITGVVVSSKGAPVSGVHVVATSPSQTASAATDAGGHFAFLSLSPDTYTIDASKPGFRPASVTGVSVFADQVQTLRIALAPSLKTIAKVTSRSSMDLVKSGTTTDVYSVNAAVTQAVQGVGGGGSLTSAYSALATVPGVFVPPNQQGWNQTVYIRGGNYDQIGYEYDGVPVNRSFDNYPGSTAGTLGQQELQVYAGGGTVGQSTSGLAGFINQVIKTGTYPGYANVNAGIGTPTYYHNLQLEVGGATPDRLFSYYAGIGGYNQDYRYLNQFNGAALSDVWGFATIADNTSLLYNFPGVYPTCVTTAPAGSGFYSGPNASPVYDPFQLKPGQPGYLPLPAGAVDPGCYQTISPAYASYSNIADRESVVNVHVGIPHRHDPGRDDVQLLYNVVALQSQFYSSANDIGPHLIQQLNEVRGFGNLPELWSDFLTWPAGTSFGENAAGLKAVPYFMPSSPAGRCANIDPYAPAGTPPLVAGACPGGAYSAIPLNARDGFWNNAAIAKLQYQHNIGSSAYWRIYGYTFYSDWLQNSPLSFASNLYGFGVTSYDYELESHTRGLAFSFDDQLGNQHLLSFDANYTTATTNRYNNTTYNNDTPYPGYASYPSGVSSATATSYTNGTECFDPASGQRAPCNDPSTSGTFLDPAPAVAHPVPGASWRVTYTGNSGFINNVVPNFTAVALEDRWQPSDRLDVNVGLRNETYEYDLANTDNNGQNFWFLAGQQEFCYNPVTLQPYVIPALPASGRPATPFIGFNCPVDTSIPSHPVQTVHPDGKDGHLLLSNVYSPTLTDNAFTPRFGLTYTLDPDTVLRLSAGRFAQEPQTYQVQYNAKDNNLAYDLFQAWWPYGYTTPKHDPLVQYSNNYDASYERHFKGTDMSLKVTPYYRYATNQIYGVSLPFGLAGGLNSGIERIDGVELEFTKGDFDKNGLSLLFSYTYTNAAERWADYPGTTINPIDPYNQDIANYNGLTKAGGGALCYVNNSFTGVITPDPNCKPLSANPHADNSPPIWNPYYAMRPQPLLDRNGWYPVGLDFAYLSPNVASLVVNYKHDRFSITPAVTFNEGEPYGNPADVAGYDPRTCRSVTPYHALNPHQADYTSCVAANTQNGTSPGTLFIPGPQTGVFDSFGSFRQPNQLNLSMTMGYRLSARVKATLLLANLLNACFGGSSEPWSKQFPPNSYTCGYIDNAYYIANFYNGSSPNDVRANGVPLNQAFTNAYTPAWADTNSLVLPNPFNAYVQLSVRL